MCAHDGVLNCIVLLYRSLWLFALHVAYIHEVVVHLIVYFHSKQSSRWLFALHVTYIHEVVVHLFSTAKQSSRMQLSPTVLLINAVNTECVRKVDGLQKVE